MLTTKALEFLDGYEEDDRPFFLYLAPCEFWVGPLLDMDPLSIIVLVGQNLCLVDEMVR